MPAQAVELLSARSHSLIKALRKLSQDSTAYRRLGRCWVEGEHLAQAALQRGFRFALGVYAQSHWPQAEPMAARLAERSVVVPDALFATLSGLASPAQVGFVLDVPQPGPLQAHAPTVVLDRLQDAGNVGSILRSAAAFGFRQVLALKGTAALWSPKVLRAGMGSHFALTLLDGVDADVLDTLALPLLVTSSHAGVDLHTALQQRSLPNPCAWVFGHEGQGVSPTLAARASTCVRIAQPGGEESLNVAAAAAICLHASASVARG